MEALRVLLVEDSPDDAALVARELRRGGFEAVIHQVETAPATLSALEQEWDLVIADFALPTFSGLEALRLIRDREIDVPFLLVSGTVGEETAVAAMRAGANDYLLKHNLARLVPAIRRELKDAEGRRRRRRAEASLVLLADWGVKLAASSLDPVRIATIACELAVPLLARWCALTSVDDYGDHRRLAAIHGDPGREELFARLPAATWPFVPAAAPGGVGARLEVAATELEALVPDPAARGAVLELGLASVIALPLVAHGRTIGALTFARAPEDKAYDEADVELAQQLAVRVALALDNARLYTEAQRAITLRDEFLHIASHELRTPLTPLELELDMTRRQIPRYIKGDDAAAWLDGHLAAIRRHVNRLGRLVEEMLNVGRISAAGVKLDLAPTELRGVVREVVLRFEQAGDVGRARSEIRLHADEEVVCMADRGRLLQALTHLVSNALKFGAGQPIDVLLHPRGGSGEIVVVDRGMGIARADQSRIFQRFERVASTANYGGFGVGLYVVKKIIDAMGGTVSVVSTPGEGASFYVRLPIDDAAKRLEAQPA